MVRNTWPIRNGNLSESIGSTAVQNPLEVVRIDSSELENEPGL
jgi:hypothetical protein